MSSKMVVFSDASGPVKPLNGFFLVFFFHVALGCKNGENASSVDRLCIKFVFHASSVVLDSCSDKVHCFCAVAAISQIQHQIFCNLFSCVLTTVPNLSLLICRSWVSSKPLPPRQ